MVEKKTGKRAKTVDKWKRKKLFSILAPRIFDRKEIAETPALKEKQVIGRTIVLTLDKLTGNRMQRHIDVKFKVMNVAGLKAETEIMGHEIKGSYLGRIVRRRRSKIVSTNIVSTKDNVRMKIIAMALTARKAERRKEKAIRRLMSEEITKSALKNSKEEMIEEMLSSALGTRIFRKARKIAVLKRVEILKSRILRG